MARECTSYYVVLGLIHLGISTGYDIKKKIKSEIGYFYKVSNGQLYPILKRLLSDGTVTCEVESNDGRPDRKVYSITEKGVNLFTKWLSSGVSFRSDNENELVLRLYFGAAISAIHNIELLDGFKKSKEKNLQIYNSIAEGFNLSTIHKKSDYYIYFTLRCGQLVAKAYQDWSEEVISVLRRLEEKEKN